MILNSNSYPCDRYHPANDVSGDEDERRSDGGGVHRLNLCNSTFSDFIPNYCRFN